VRRKWRLLGSEVEEKRKANFVTRDLGRRGLLNN
jgi:hypothetical protein